ncbi:WAP-type 'four-disulfide core [Trichuris suis]|nr:WAP-type 'four-disulfide core [Trichuris suis]
MIQLSYIFLAGLSIEIFCAMVANSATAPKLGTCPSTNVTVSKNIPCTNDSVCSGEQKCCETSSGLMCVDPKELSEKPKPGDCPQVYLHPSKWGSNHQCLGDSQCSGNMKCCPHERGRMCRRPPGFPAESKPGKCRIVACSSPLARVKSCYSDRSCAGNLKCCPTTSGGAVCRTPVY